MSSHSRPFKAIFLMLRGLLKGALASYLIGCFLYLLFFIFGHDGLLPGMSMKIVFDNLSRKSIYYLFSIILASFSIQFISLASMYYAIIIYKRTGYQFESNIRKLLFKLIFKFGHSASHSGQMFTVFRDDVHELAWVAPSLLTFPRILISVAAFVAMWRINALMAVLVTAAAILLIWLTSLLGPYIDTLRHASRQAGEACVGFLGEISSAVHVIKMGSAESSIMKEVDKRNRARARISIREFIFGAFADSAGVAMVGLITGLILILSANEMREGRFSVGDFVLFCNYVFAAMMLPTFISGNMTMLRRASVSLSRIGNLAGEPLESHIAGIGEIGKNDAPKVDPFRSLRIENLSVVTNVGMPILSNVSFKIDRDEFVVVTGKVGSGKTTLLKSINGLVQAHSGQLFWNDQPVESARLLMVPPHCAYVPQVPNMFNESVLANILMGAQVDQAVVEKAIYDAVFDVDVERLERGLLTLVGGRGTNLSGGQVQRLAVARGLVRTPEILLCDDMSSGLDVVTEEALWERIRSRRGMTCIAVSHRLAAFTRATQIIVLDAGGIVGMGSFEALKTSCPQFQDILHGA